MKISENVRTGFLIGCLVLGAALFIGNIVRHMGEPTFFKDARDRPWPSTPIVVSYSADVAKAFEAEVRKAVEHINDSVGCTLLTTTGEHPQIRILTALDDVPCKAAALHELPKTIDATTFLCAGTADILLEKVIEPRHAYVIVQHELGHALGLDHDEQGLMAKRWPEAEWQRTDVPLPRLSIRDATALRERYCR